MTIRLFCRLSSLVIETMRGGAVDFLDKPIGKDTLIKAVSRALVAGAESAAAGADVINYQKVFATLTPRQHQVLGGILEGQLNKTMAHDFGVSRRTVEMHRADIMNKTHAPRSGALIRMALLAGM